jgi:replication factor C large subunit
MQFIEKYRPKKIREIIGQDDSLRQLMRFVLNVLNKKTLKKGVILYGPPGTGKTSAAYAVAAETNAEAIELNASDFRDKESIKNIIGNAIRQKSLFEKHKIIIVDELEGIHGRQDYGGLNELMKVLNESVYPIIFITNQLYDEKFRELRKQTEMIQFSKISEESLKKILQSICSEEKAIINEQTLRRIVLLSDGDARAAVNDLQTIMSGRKQLEESHIKVLGKREREESIFSALNFIFKGKSHAVTGAFNNVDMETDELILWIDENLPLEYSGRELSNAYKYLSKADIFRRRIVRNQHWRFMSYINDLITAGIAFSKETDKDKFVKYRRTSRLLKMWIENQTKKKVIAQKVAKRIHCSLKKAYKEMPYIERMYKNNDFREKIDQELELEKEEKFYLLAR